MKYVIMIAALLVILAGCTQQAETVDTSAPMPVPKAPSTEEMVVEDQDVKTFRIEGINYRFLMDGEESPELRVKQGDRVRIEFESTQGFHDWVVDEFSAATAQVRPADGITTVEFVADKTGTFEYYCSVGQHRANGMFGNLIVE